MRRGIYIFINHQSGTAMDLIGDDNLLVGVYFSCSSHRRRLDIPCTGIPPNDSDSQKWEVAPLGAGHTIRNVKTGKYLAILHATKEEPIVATNFPVAWHMKKIFVIEENTAFFEIRWPNTEFMFEGPLVTGGRPIKPGPPRPSSRLVPKVTKSHSNGIVTSANVGNKGSISNAHRSGPRTTSLATKLEFESS
ncbi:carbohydrate-binding module family 13 protein [Scleroderma citrinum Foug A]|uniref:Carbohydrate-binding module family 13 protein n=1 Tax=Scleroderma citrinum Foug A TaxID=1036808 RepID=A0A0C3DVQ7_9AGAM|nr:carbohydrate-binding module family 13 protein [Scleroderma citrinum Foug A]